MRKGVLKLRCNCSALGFWFLGGFFLGRADRSFLKIWRLPSTGTSTETWKTR